jgi:hypothetical protein
LLWHACTTVVACLNAEVGHKYHKHNARWRAVETL